MSCVTVVPIYQERLSPLEEFSLDYSLARLAGEVRVFIAPEALDVSYYRDHFPALSIRRYASDYFSSVQGYNRLLLSEDFYRGFADQGEFILILQPDAIVLRNELPQWCAQAYDYIGAPWPGGVEISVNVDCFAGANAKTVKVQVGNGGLSLRRNAACVRLLQEFPQAADMFLRSGSSEDLFFSIMGSQSERFVVPNERVASLFSLELQPEHYFAINQCRPPMGGHAWWRYNQPFWNALLETPPPEFRPAGPPGTPVLSGASIAA
ncbi:MAG: DUF5672 family protein [Rhodoferax sp.]